MIQSLLPLLALALPWGTSAHDPAHNMKRHGDLAKRISSDAQNITKRVDGARMTYYDVGLGACGITNVPSDFIVAVSAAEYDAGLGNGWPSDVCFKSITIEFNGIQAQAQVTDRCEICPSFTGLDLSYDLFKVFAPEPEVTGIIAANWWYNDGSNGGGGAATTTSTSEPPPPTSTWTPPPETTTSTWSPPPEPTTTSSSSSEWSSSSESSSEWTSSSESSSSSSSSTESATATTTSSAAAAFTAGSHNVVDSLRQVIQDMGGVILAAAAIPNA
ncbi:hypothetical protein BD626DRAFT_433796 [Schizophyllum amplum]|uniref:RlpA-like double-psi beta-barrel-protein domain-containing protein-containing protein n=1 Tax=Schizophyllum amplum TaxID=97359 RepID=A0A550CAE8_9AGAR|nr:hypothetical protein BD626DRAFT_433796 [Auriculariopsis ampla]